MAPITNAEKYAETVDFWRSVYGINSKQLGFMLGFGNLIWLKLLYFAELSHGSYHIVSMPVQKYLKVELSP